MRENPNDVSILVDKLNNESTSLLEHGSWTARPFVFKDDGDTQAVEFLGLVVWDSEEDERAWHSGGEVLETLESFIRKSADEKIRHLSNLKY